MMISVQVKTSHRHTQTISDEHTFALTVYKSTRQQPIQPKYSHKHLEDSASGIATEHGNILRLLG